MLGDQLQQILSSLSALSFELGLVIGSFLLLIVGMVTSSRVAYKVVYVLVLLVGLFLVDFGIESELIVNQNLAINDLHAFLKALFVFSGIWIVFYPTAGKHRSEFYFLLLSVVVGSTFMLSANNLLVIYLVVELTSFASYLLTNFNFEKKSFEASIKYLLFGGVSSALALYGASILFGYSGTLDLSLMDFGVVENDHFLNLGITLFVGGLLFKISIVPFHIWVPTTYEAAPTGAVAVLSIVPKVAGLVLLNNVLDSLHMMDQPWMVVMVAILGMATIVIGTFGALQQTNVKRMIAYGAIAHSGFLLATLLIPFENGMSAFVWYSVVYALMNITVFYLVALFESKGLTTIEQFAGLSSKESYLGGIVVVAMIALVGLPPTSGFTIKFYLFTIMWEWCQSVGDPWVLSYLIVAVSSVVFSLFFYLKLPYFIFFKEGKNLNYSRSSLSQRIIATIFTLLVLWLFFSPEILNNIANNIKFLDW
ncbi:NADH-quinone oxidoreductase subunit N [Marinoscillum sp.]|uniref:NADH-quinone oxidoreductase subunit N n=1 Tax=Marinoscillum sp. TaxID=2024838 RepID=UPI003BA94A11